MFDWLWRIVFFVVGFTVVRTSIQETNSFGLLGNTLDEGLALIWAVIFSIAVAIPGIPLSYKIGKGKKPAKRRHKTTTNLTTSTAAETVPTETVPTETVPTETVPTETVLPDAVLPETVHENYYLIATREVESARKKEALWAKVVALNEGLQEGARSKYITLRAKQLQEGMGPEGAFFEGTYKDGEKDGPWATYHENGQLAQEGAYKNGKRHGPWVAYHEDGQLDFKGDYKDDKRDGPWVWYYENGHKKTMEIWKNGKTVGPSIRYTEDGKAHFLRG
jgi:hypothetical protein